MIQLVQDWKAFHPWTRDALVEITKLRLAWRPYGKIAKKCFKFFREIKNITIVLSTTIFKKS